MRFLINYSNSMMIEHSRLSDFRNFLLHNVIHKESMCNKVKTAITLLFPITSIFIGMCMLKNVFTLPGKLSHKIAYTITGLTASLGLGIIILALQITYSFIGFLFLMTNNTLNHLIEDTRLKNNKLLKISYMMFNMVTEFLINNENKLV